MIAVIFPPPPHLTAWLQVLGIVMIAVGAWLEVQERSIVAAIESDTFLAGPYLIIAAGCAVVLVAVIGMIGALCDKKINRFLLIFVSAIHFA